MFTKIWTIAKAILAIVGLLRDIKGSYDRYLDRKIEKHYARKAKVSDQLNTELNAERAKEEPDEEKLKDILRRLNNLDTAGKLRVASTEVRSSEGNKLSDSKG